MNRDFRPVKEIISILAMAILIFTLVGPVAYAGNGSQSMPAETQMAYDEAGITTLWNMGYTGSGMKIAIIDDGVDYKNPDLGGCLGPNCKVIGGWDVDTGDDDPMSLNPNTSHGTLLAGEMVANGSMKGIAYDAKLLAYKADGSGGADVGFRALERLLQDGGADYLNFSSGFTVQGKEDNFTKDFSDPYYKSLYEQAEKQGMLIFRSAGNFGSALLETVEHPFPVFHSKYYFMPVGNRVSEPTMLNIGAYQWDHREVSEVTSMGPSLNGEMQPELLAPVGYPITYMPGAYSRTGGTSCAAPFAGAVATLVKQAHPEWTPADVRTALMNTASVIYNKVTGEPVTMLIQGSGLIDGVAAVKTPALVTPYEINMTATGLHPVELTIKNITDKTETFTAKVELTLGNYEYGANQGLDLSLTTSKLVIGPHETATVGLLSTADLGKLSKGPHEALIWLSNGTTTLHVPIMIWNDLNSIWWSRAPDDYIGSNKDLPPKLTNVRTSTVIVTSEPLPQTVSIDFTVNRGSIVGYTWGTAEPTFGNYADRVRVEIVNSQGATVAKVFDERHLLIGHYQAFWNGLDSKGQPVPAGEYRYVISAIDDFQNFDIEIRDTNAQFTGVIAVKSASDIGKITPATPVTPVIGPPNASTTSLAVVNTDPANGARGVSINKVINVAFNKPIQLVDASKITFGGVNFNVAVDTSDNTKLVITPKDKLNYSTSYTVTIGAGAVADLAGNRLLTDYSFSFTTAAEQDPGPPEVISSYPANGETNVPITPRITFTFSKIVNIDLMNKFFFVDSNGNRVDFAPPVLENTATLVIIPDNPSLKYGTTYKITLKADAVTDENGKHLDSDYIITFTTVAEEGATALTVVNTDPANGASDVAVDKAITVTFSEDVAEANKFADVALKNADGQSVPVKVAITGSVITITPNKPLDYSTKYTLTVPAGAVKGLSGNALEKDYTFSFTTAALSVKTFDDIKGHWAQHDIELMAGLGIAQGVGGNKFNPDGMVTRAEFVALLARSMGVKTEPVTQTSFKDVPADAWYAAEVEAAYKFGIVKGFEDGTFRPDDKVTREQIASFIIRAMNWTISQSDVSLILNKFTDQSKISNWAKEAVASAVQHAIVVGRPNGTFDPQANATRAEAIVMLKRMLQASGVIPPNS